MESDTPNFKWSEIQDSADSYDSMGVKTTLTVNDSKNFRNCLTLVKFTQPVISQNYDAFSVTKNFSNYFNEYKEAALYHDGR